MFRRFFAFFAVLLALTGASAASAQDEPQIESAFSDTIISNLGYPEIEIVVSPEGIEAPSTLEAGYYLVTLDAPDDYSAYLDFMQPPAGLSEEEATELALAAARDDLVQEGWGYAGGSNTFDPDEPVSFVIEFSPGEYQIAASYYAAGSEEVMRLEPLTITAPGTPDDAAEATPTADEPPATVTLEMTDDLRYIVSSDPVPAGPQIWEITNTGVEHSHHVVMWQIPDDITADEIVADFTALMSGTPPAGPPLFTQFTGVGYAALQSGGQTTWVEFDLDPATYAVICYIIDPHTGTPHVLDGMVTLFTVE